MAANDPRLLTWGCPLVGLAGTVTGMIVAFARMGTESQWTTMLVGLGFSLVAVVAGLNALMPLVLSRRSRLRLVDRRMVRQRVDIRCRIDGVLGIWLRRRVCRDLL